MLLPPAEASSPEEAADEEEGALPGARDEDEVDEASCQAGIAGLPPVPLEPGGGGGEPLPVRGEEKPVPGRVEAPLGADPEAPPAELRDVLETRSERSDLSSVCSSVREVAVEEDDVSNICSAVIKERRARSMRVRNAGNDRINSLRSGTHLWHVPLHAIDLPRNPLHLLLSMLLPILELLQRLLHSLQLLVNGALLLLEPQLDRACLGVQLRQGRCYLVVLCSERIAV